MTTIRTVLVTGGAGYIGSHAVLALLDAGYRVHVLDNLTTGTRAAIPDGVPLHVGDVGRGEDCRAALQDSGAQAVMHFAGSIRVDESVADPLKYYGNNTAATRTLLEACVEAGVAQFVFSSTAATYGIPDTAEVDEDSPTRPINPYGWSKLMSEQMMEDLSAVAVMKIAILRYFNVAGADPALRTGQRTPNATHLIKVACEVATGQRPGMQLFGTDYDTADGTCVRDYIHVSDLAQAHVEVLRWHAAQENPLVRFNCGYGSGFSVREVIAAVERITGKTLAVSEVGRRAGDPPALVSDATRLRTVVGWQPRHDSLDAMIGTAFRWEETLAAAKTESAIGS